jgi:hypothetical protein
MRAMGLDVIVFALGSGLCAFGLLCVRPVVSPDATEYPSSDR